MHTVIKAKRRQKNPKTNNFYFSLNSEILNLFVINSKMVQYSVEDFSLALSDFSPHCMFKQKQMTDNSLIKMNNDNKEN